MQTRLQRKAAPAEANPYFAQGRGMQKKYTLHMYAKRSGVVHWDLSDKNADTNEIERVAREAVEQVEGGETLIWDRLGRSGRASHPTSQHYSPEAQAIFNTRDVTIKFVPPKGKYFNPLELLFNDLKSHYLRPKFCKMVNERVCRWDSTNYAARILQCPCKWKTYSY